MPKVGRTSLELKFLSPSPMHARLDSHHLAASLGVAGTLSGYGPVWKLPKNTSWRRSPLLNVTVICVSTGF